MLCDELQAAVAVKSAACEAQSFGTLALSFAPSLQHGICDGCGSLSASIPPGSIVEQALGQHDRLRKDEQRDFPALCNNCSD